MTSESEALVARLKYFTGCYVSDDDINDELTALCTGAISHITAQDATIARLTAALAERKQKHDIAILKIGEALGAAFDDLCPLFDDGEAVFQDGPGDVLLAEWLGLAIKRKVAEAQRVPDAYDAGLLSDYGGGNIEWWQDYIRAELERAHEHYVVQALAAAPQPPAMPDSGPIMHGGMHDTAAQDDGWRPIETAPRDGQTILIWSPYFSARPMTGHWSAEMNTWVCDLVCTPDAAADLFDATNGATHWRPLPAPPAQTQEPKHEQR